MDYIEIGSVPYAEDCVQVEPTGNYIEPMRAECRRFIDWIREVLGPEPMGARLYIKSNPHDFGTYYEVACRFNENYPAAAVYAFACESDLPPNWTYTPEELQKARIAATYEPETVHADSGMFGDY